MKIVQINTFPYKATGTIMMNIHSKLTELGHDSYVVWGRGRKAQDEHEIVISDDLGTKLHGVYTRITDRTGFASWSATQNLITKLEEIHPDCIHLHNIHGYYLNIEMLFNYIKDRKIKVVWTLHDCWPFTGHCAYFDMVKCEKWKYGCSKCEQKKTYPTTNCIDSSKWNWSKKKELFTGNDIEIVVPSVWLKNIVKESFLGKYQIHVIHNGVDPSVFKSTNSNLKNKYGMGDEFLILGVASEWTERKGLNDFIKLNHALKNSGGYRIILVGLTKKQISKIPADIIGIERTSNVQELVSIYSSADMFFNPTYEDNFPTTNLESIACGTSVITYQTGGSPESLIHPESGYVVEVGDIDAVKKIVLNNMKGFEMVKPQLDSLFFKDSMIQSYVSLYENLLSKKIDRRRGDN